MAQEPQDAQASMKIYTPKPRKSQDTAHAEQNEQESVRIWNGKSNPSRDV